MPTLHGAGESQDTKIKQDHFAKFLQMHMDICKGQMRSGGAQPPYVFFDLHAGPGVTAGADGSPLIFAKRAIGYEFPCVSYHFDKQQTNCHSLSLHLDNLRTEHRVQAHEFNVIHGDHDETINCTLSDYRYCAQKFCGLIYADPNGGKIPHAVINKILSLPCFARLEVLINVNANAIKRARGRFGETWPALSDQISPIKKSCMQVREPVGKWQWSLLMLTNWSRFPVMERQAFHWYNTQIGEQIFNVLENKSGSTVSKIVKPAKPQMTLF